MDTVRVDEENLREAAAVGNVDKVEALIRQGVDVNSRNSMNGWTALHWACNRGHQTVVEQLVQNGADSSIQNAKGETCPQLTDNPQIRILLGAAAAGEGNDSASHHVTTLPIVPNYISNPPFPHVSGSNDLTPGSNDRFQRSELCAAPSSYVAERVFKVRVANSEEKDFIEIDVPRQMTFDQLVTLMRTELAVDAKAVVKKVRKLPDTIVRNDRDVQRLCDYQELELVLAQEPAKPVGSISAVTGYRATVSPKQIDVVY